MHSDHYQALAQCIMDGESEMAAGLAQKAIEPGIDSLLAINEGFVRGAPVTQEWVKQIGADSTSKDAIGAVSVARQLLGV